ncbi:calmodulin [Diaporthe helianthi]|uniref:Calmodulin n=1 Tax=Diaporthe helianthi TaxID=158607 RepID=A0A2P5I443_DIAHE|nr:calmodulin [Diaporthe helianthi]
MNSRTQLAGASDPVSAASRHRHAPTRLAKPTMPPKRRSGGAAESGASGKAARQSKLAKEHDITAQEEAEIKEAFSLFAEPMDGEKEGVIPIDDVRRAMIALDIPPKDKNELAEFTEILDPEDEGYANYSSFVAICALKLHARDQTSDAHAREVDEAFALFTGGDPETAAESGGVITVAHLKRVAAVLKEEVDDSLLRDMILEANGGAGVGKGVKRSEFDHVMRRAGVWR